MNYKLWFITRFFSSPTSSYCDRDNELVVEDLVRKRAYANFSKDKYNDLYVAIDDSIYHQLLDKREDNLLAKLYAHLFFRDRQVIYSEFDDNLTSSN